MRTRRLLAAAVGAALAAVVTGCGTSAPPGSSSTRTAISFNDASCGRAWHLAAPGWHTFEIRNEADYGAEVDLTNPANGAVYDELENIGPDTSAPMSLDVGSGTYAFLCEVEDFDPVTGPTVTVGGHAPGARAVLPVTYNDLYPLAKEYGKYTEAGLQVLARQTTSLAADVRGGRLAAAKRDWLTAHLQYETLGAAYDAFGNFDGEIDGRADAVGVSSPKWTGFYRLEYGLWHGQSARELTGVADTLNTDVHKLAAWWPAQQIPLVDIGLRTHEILENALEYQLTGHDDYGSGTTLATTLANIDGTRYLLSLLHPLLVPRYPQLPEVYTGLNQLQSLIEKERLPDGTWVPVSRLPVATQQNIDAACGQVLQELAPIASIAEPRNTASEF
ncbi:MAG TPA: EfeM/EfeO family lipoprotein [Streptosporangiaceae bacterium]|jgi:iron uptake system EfeUOB component EfeO/EfeM|nr:EfeM/EfeO family lipoprotein [Streptosporangiaceae bacterium]